MGGWRRAAPDEKRFKFFILLLLLLIERTPCDGVPRLRGCGRGPLAGGAHGVLGGNPRLFLKFPDQQFVLACSGNFGDVPAIKQRGAPVGPISSELKRAERSSYGSRCGRTLRRCRGPDNGRGQRALWRTLRSLALFTHALTGFHDRSGFVRERHGRTVCC